MTQKLTLGQLKDLHYRFHCDAWREAIKKYLVENVTEPDTSPITIEEKDIENARRNATYTQRQALKEQGVILDASNPFLIDVDATAEFKEFCLKAFGSATSAMVLSDSSAIEIDREDLKGRAFYVNSDYKVILHDTEFKGTVVELKKK